MMNYTDYYQNPEGVAGEGRPEGGSKPKKGEKKPKALNTRVVLYLGELPPDVDQYELHQFIMSLGKFNIESLIVKPTKENKSYAYVKFKNEIEVEKARLLLNLKSWKNYVIKAEQFKQKSNLGEEAVVKKEKLLTGGNLFIKNLQPNTTPKDLYDLFTQYGTIVSIKLKQNTKGECLGYGYVNYDNAEEANMALKNLDGVDLLGKSIQVTTFSTKGEREEQETFPLVLIKQMPENINNEKMIEEIFEKFGQITFSGYSSHQQQIQDGKEGENSVAVVLYNTREEAQAAVRQLNNQSFNESEIPFILSIAPVSQEMIEKLNQAKREKMKTKYQGCNLVVKNINKDITDQLLFEIFKQFGNIKSARIATEGVFKEIKNEQGLLLDKEFVYESKGYGFVLFKNAEDANKAKEGLNNVQYKYKDKEVKLGVEFYDYSKAKGEGGDKKEKGGKGGKKYNNNNNNQNNNYKKNPRPKVDYQSNDVNEGGDQNQVINNRMMINTQGGKKFNNNQGQGQGNNNNYNNRFDNNQGNQNIQNQNRQMMNPNQQQMNPNQQQMNPNQQQMNPNQQQMNPNQQQMNPNQMNQQQMNQYNQMQQMRMNQMNQMQQMQQNQSRNITQPKGRNDNGEFVDSIKKIIQITNIEEKTELLGETIFYFLMSFISKYNLNQSNGKFDDTHLCSKLTGIFLQTDEKEIIEIFSNSEILMLTIKDVVMVILYIIVF